MEVDAAVAGDGSRDSLDLSVLMGPGAPAYARGRINGWLTGMVPDGVLVDAQLLISELVTNTLHAEFAASVPLSIAGHLHDGVLWMEVANPGHDGTVARRDATANDGGGGYGLPLVEVLALRWGVNRDDIAADTRVWFELATA
jgi:anti-sigma regulatory factor (Ser/Thr protein kinase)